jgi:hypothetical protein
MMAASRLIRSRKIIKCISFLIRAHHQVKEVFLLPTKYGSLVFAFTRADDALKAYMEFCNLIVQDGYEMETVIILENSESALTASIGSEIPHDVRFALVVEDTPEFDQLFDELADNKIWPDVWPDKR